MAPTYGFSGQTDAQAASRPGGGSCSDGYTDQKQLLYLNARNESATEVNAGAVSFA